MPPVPDPAAQRTDLERQLALLAPVVQHLRVEAAPHWVIPTEWRGPAADAAARMRDELVRRIDLAADGVDDLVRIVRLQLAELP